MSFYYSMFLLIGSEVGPNSLICYFMGGVGMLVGSIITAVFFGEMAVVMSNMSVR